MRIEINVESLYLNSNPDSLVGKPRKRLAVDLKGIVGGKYYGTDKFSDTRDRELTGDPYFPKGILVRNWRQWSAVSTEELSVIASKLRTPDLDGSLLGANISFSGLENLTQLPKGTLLHFPNEAILLVEAENKPCLGPGKEIARVYNHVNPSNFPKAALGLRGLVGVVYRPGFLKVGDVARVQLYEPRHYSLPPRAT